MRYTTLLSMITINILMANESNVEKKESIELDKITVSASPVNTHEAFDVPCQVDIIGKKAINLSSTASLGEILSSVAGVNNISTGSQAGKPMIRAMSGERVKILSNGSPTDFQTYGSRHISTIDPFLADKIEIIRGANGVLYGSDALGGIVNVISPNFLHTDAGKTIYNGEFKGEFNTNNNEWATAIKAKTAIGKVGVNLGVSKRKADNYKTGKSESWKAGQNNDLPLFSGELPYSDFETVSAQIGIGYTEDDYQMSIQNTNWESSQNYLGHTPTPTFQAVSSAGQKLKNNETQLKGSVNMGEWLIGSQIAHTKNSREASTNIPYQQMQTAKGTPAYLDIEVKRDDVKLYAQHPTFMGLDGQIGIEGYTKEQTLKSGKLVPSADETSKAIYLFEEANRKDWILQGGLRYETKEIDAPVDGTNSYFVSKGIYNATNNTQDFSSWGGTIGATYKIDDNFAIASNLSKGFRSPSIFELFAGGVHGGVQAFQIGNPNLQPEDSLGADISLRYKEDSSNANLTVYQNHIDNYIYLANTGYKRHANTGDRAGAGLDEMINEQTDAKIEGIEFSGETKLLPSTTLRGSLELIRGIDKRNDTKLGYIPPNNAKIGITQKLGEARIFSSNELSIHMKMYDKKSVASSKEPFAQYNSTPFGSANTSSYALFDVAYGSKVAIGSKKVDFNVKVNNLFDRAYRDYLDTYKGYALGMGRNISFNLSVPFGSK